LNLVEYIVNCVKVLRQLVNNCELRWYHVITSLYGCDDFLFGKGENMYEIFKNYVSNYDLNNVKIKHKYDHTLRVVEAAKKLSDLLNLSEEDKYLAEVIALLHDTGRFEQLKIYDTFMDKDSIDHADFAVKLLFDDNLIELFDIEDKYYPIIRKAIFNHNKLEIDAGLTEQELFHAKLIRDADKVDILAGLPLEYRIGFNEVDEEISPAIMEQIRNEQTVSFGLIQNPNDKLALSFAFVFNIYFDETINIIYENKYYEKYFESLEYKEYFREVFDIVTNYIEKRMNLEG